jgi:hypothetical protein
MLLIWSQKKMIRSKRKSKVLDKRMLRNLDHSKPRDWLILESKRLEKHWRCSQKASLEDPSDLDLGLFD